MLMRDSEGKLVSVPSYSPEHGPRTAGNTYEHSLIWQLYEDTIKMLNYGFNNYKTIAPFKTMNTVLKDDTYGFLKTGNELSPYKIPLKHLNDVTVMLEKKQSASKLTYKCKDNKYIISYDGKQIGSVKLY